MSSTIEYNRIAFKGNHNGKEKYVLAVRAGCSNVYETGTGLRAKDWHLMAFGSLGDIWKRIGEMAGHTEGGMLQRNVGWNESRSFTIEEYVKLYRSKIKNAKPMERILNDFNITCSLYFKEDAPEDEIISKYNFKYQGKHFLHEDKVEYTKTMDTLEEFLTLLDLKKNYSMRFDLHPLKKRL